MAATPSGPRTRRPEGPAILLRLRTTVNGTKGEFAAVQQIVGFLGCC
jgi:hypothetical protein